MNPTEHYIAAERLIKQAEDEEDNEIGDPGLSLMYAQVHALLATASVPEGTDPALWAQTTGISSKDLTLDAHQPHVVDDLTLTTFGAAYKAAEGTPTEKRRAGLEAVFAEINEARA